MPVLFAPHSVPTWCSEVAQTALLLPSAVCLLCNIISSFSVQKPVQKGPSPMSKQKLPLCVSQSHVQAAGLVPSPAARV